MTYNKNLDYGTGVLHYANKNNVDVSSFEVHYNSTDGMVLKKWESDVPAPTDEQVEEAFNEYTNTNKLDECHAKLEELDLESSKILIRMREDEILEIVPSEEVIAERREKLEAINLKKEEIRTTLQSLTPAIG